VLDLDRRVTAPDGTYTVGSYVLRVFIERPRRPAHEPRHLFPPRRQCVLPGARRSLASDLRSI